MPAKGQKKALKFDWDKYFYIEEYTEPDQDKMLKRERIKGQYTKNPTVRYRINAAKRYDVPVEQLEKVYEELNGRKIDGFFVTDILDRHGFSGWPINRQTLSEQYKKRSTKPLEIAEAKVMKIAKSHNIRKAYQDYINDVQEEQAAEVEEKRKYGEAEA